ncbi:hypothetical protein [Patulibacter sp. SYSU D01012]|uniref:hypothetical protein n=1 Tax=Patulibacter sp. SYSU D01012 TaxID=2817381 RepID=UPI001B3105AB|nr:hypothetical protein [Patulibacter sp. SYSU D01012]
MLPAAIRQRPGRWWTLLAVLLAAASLPLGHALAFDASAWVTWGRELWTLDLATGAGPSWKPFPVLFTAPFAVLGDGAGAAWLVVARAGALLAVVGAARLAARAAGPWAAVVAAGALVLSPWWLLNGALGNADPVLGALVVWALLAHGDGHDGRAFALAAAGALIRPEAWPFVALFALWLVRRGALPWRTVLLTGAGVLALWVVPDLLSSGLRSTRGATGPASAGSAALTDVPFLTVLEDLGRQGPWLALAAAVAGAAVAARRRAGVDPRPWLAIVVAYVLLVAVMAQIGFAGNPRYLVPALVLLSAAAGTVVALAGPAARGAGGAAVAAVVVAGLLVTGVPDLRDQAEALRERAAVRRSLFAAVDAAGGAAAATARGPVRAADPGLRALVAEALRESVPAATARPRSGDAVARRAPDGAWTLR